MMSKTDPHSSAEHSGRAQSPRGASDEVWHQLESFVDQLHESAHSPINAEQFYRDLLEGCVTLLAAEGGAVWMPAGRGLWKVLQRIGSETAIDGALGEDLLPNVGTLDHTTLLQPHSSSELGANHSDFILVMVPIIDDSDASHPAVSQACVQLLLRPGASPAVQQGWRELLDTVAAVATEFHVRQQLRQLQSERGLYDQSLELMRRFQRCRDLTATGYEIANEGRRFVGADRLTVVIRRGTDWKLLATSGVQRVEPRADVTKRLEQLAAATSDWGEPLTYADTSSEQLHDLPPSMTTLVERHVDESQARRLIAVPVEQFADSHTDQAAQPRKPLAVLIAEQFTSDESELSLQRALELAALSQSALAQSLQLDRFPVRSSLRWADRWDEWCTKLGLTKLVAAAVVIAVLLAALTFVRVDYEIEASAMLRPQVERDIFASTDGKISEIRIAHGEEVEAGQVLAVLHDPQLLLDTQRVEGEIATTRKRLEAIAVARTDRQVREDANPERLPLAAEAEQLQKRLASLLEQQKILALRQAALTLRSPIDGTVLTLDVQNLLRTRPVQRGQVLFTIADTTAGWRLQAEVPQDRIGEVLTAQRESTEHLPVRFRLAGENDQTYAGQIASISTTAVLDTDGLDQESPAFEVLVDIDQGEQFLARPGMSAEARILCGQRSLGYLWLHDIWDTVYRWLVF